VNTEELRAEIRTLNPYNYRLTKEYLVLQQCAHLAEELRILTLENTLLKEELRKCKKKKL
jgi:hypothetical protein